jgi:hypothetical protein
MLLNPRSAPALSLGYLFVLKQHQEELFFLYFDKHTNKGVGIFFYEHWLRLFLSLVGNARVWEAVWATPRSLSTRSAGSSNSRWPTALHSEETPRSFGGQMDFSTPGLRRLRPPTCLLLQRGMTNQQAIAEVMAAAMILEHSEIVPLRPPPCSF